MSAGSIVGAVLGKYRILAELSAGGQGEVYRAQHEILGKTAAVKVLRAGLSENAELVTRFVNEAKAASAIRHPGIIEILDFGTTDDGRAYLAMEFLEGEPLSKRLRRRGRLDEREAAEIGRGIASALGAAHAKGIYHRDLKPDNVFIVPDLDTPSRERPKLLDFGIAKLVDQGTGQTRTGALIGTPLYMAPEQARAAGAIDHRADLYSLGCILYELVVGEPPFVGTGAGEIITLQMFEEPAPPSSRVTIAPGFERVIGKLLAKEPGDRYASAAQVVSALETAFSSGGDRARLAPSHARKPPDTSAPLFETQGGTPPRRNLLPIVAAVVTLGIAGIAVAVLARGGESPAPAPALAPPPPRDPPIQKAAPAPVEPAPVEPVVVKQVETPPVTRVKRGHPAAPGTQAGSQSSLPVTKRGSPIELTP
ncbi:MAG: serine/threonine protein kinase [Kofleriaceae bacterium]|nr:serine/threonine protein kinase [Kofleriaceae bacterium]